MDAVNVETLNKKFASQPFFLNRSANIYLTDGVFLNFLLIHIYRWTLAPAALLLFPLIALCGNKKIREGLKLRWKQSHNRLPTGSTAPIWIHCASGEFEYAKPIIRALKKSQPKQSIIITYFSPTYVATIEADPSVDLCLPIPWDLPGPISSFIKEHRPSALLIARTDLWPEVLEQCQRRRIPTLLFAATQSSRPGFFKTWLLNKLDKIHVVSEADQRHLKKNVKTDIFVAGDSRYEQVRFRLENPSPVKYELFHNRKLPTLLAGSTWKADEKILLEALSAPLIDQKLQLVLVPHEPTDKHVSNLETEILQKGLTSIRYTDIDQWHEHHILIVNTVGILADLYKFSDAAFIGGSFNGSVHSVMEATSLGLPVVVGPDINNNREALEFNQLALTPNLKAVEICKTEEQLRVAVLEIAENQGQREQWRSIIKTTVDKKIGASQKALQWLAELNH